MFRVIFEPERSQRVPVRIWARTTTPETVRPEHSLRQLVEEAPSAYRDIGEVLDDQRDLVRRRVRLEPLAVLKG
jgi:RNA-splicing ligase RtcB